MSLRLQPYLRGTISGRATRVGPFLAAFDHHDANPFLNYAIPDDGATPTGDDVAALVAAFVERRRTPRLEFVADRAVEAALVAAGFLVDNRMPLLAVSPAELRDAADNAAELRDAADNAAGPRPAADTADVVAATTDAELWAVAGALDRAYDGTDATRATVERLRSTVDRGGRVALARVGGEPVGGGAYTPPRDGLCLVWGVGVLASYRRRGVATAVAGYLSRAAHDAGTTPFLEVEGPAERRLYERLGYRQVGEATTMSLPVRVPAGRLVLEPVTVQRARDVLAGDLSAVRAGAGWPHADTRDGLGMVAAGASRAWLVLLDGLVIGDCGTVGPVSDAGAVEIGYGLAAPYRGRGHGTELVRALSRALLAEPGVRRVTAHVERADNLPSRRALEAAGFRLVSDDEAGARYELGR